MTVYVGDLLTATAASVTGKPTPSRTWQWLRNGTAISGATSSTYTTVEADLAANISVRQTETNIAGSAEATSLTVGPINAFSPAALFNGGEEGAWYEPSTTTCFTDTGGTTPATYGDGVAYLEDLSGNGNHATQVTVGARPILARVPESGRRNLLEKTEQFDDAYWLANSGGTGTDPVLTSGQSDPDGGTGAWRIQFNKGAGTTSSDFSLLGRSVIPDAVGNNTFSFYAKSNTGVSQNLMAYCTPNLTPTVDTFTVTDAWQRFDLTYTGDGSLASLRIGARGSVTYGGDDTLDVLIYAPQLETGSTATAYQKVVSEYDITEAGVTSLDYLSFDGSDDGMATASIDFTATDKMSVFAGVEKESETVAGVIYELSTNISSNNGSFLGVANSGSGTADYRIFNRGTGVVDAGTDDNQPQTVVLSHLGDISGDSLTIRVNGADIQQTTTDQGTANYGNYPLNIGARNNAASDWFDGKIFGLIVRGAASTAQEISLTETYLAAKSGVVL